MKIIKYSCILLSLWIGVTSAMADDFYEVDQVLFHHKAADGEPQLYRPAPKMDSNNKPVVDKNGKPVVDQIPIPFIAVNVSSKGQVRAETIVAKAYFYDENRQLIATDSSPSEVEGDWSVFVPKDQKQMLLFAVPDNVLAQTSWSAVVVFGDKLGIDAQAFSDEYHVADYEFTEKPILENKDGPPIERKTSMDPLVEHVVKTDNPKQPQITLFLRPPLGMTDASQAKGVLCMSLLAGSLDGVKRQLQGFEAGDDLKGILKFAEDRKLIIICWGSRGLWDPHKNWDDLNPDNAWNTDKEFDEVANAWATGVQYFVSQYGIPSKDYLMWGLSGSAQYACRLALRKPDYFLAVHVHIPSSFDKPTVEARKVLWCLTTGELEPGHKRSLRFFAQCKALGYPMVYKAIVGLGHAGSPIADDIGLKFFDYALGARPQRDAYDLTQNDPLAQFASQQTSDSSIDPWLESFRNPPFIGDAVNQGIVPGSDKSEIPLGFRVALPNKAIADAWNQ